jgi:ketosteroid isomerase-like protein
MVGKQPLTKVRGTKRELAEAMESRNGKSPGQARRILLRPNRARPAHNANWGLKMNDQQKNKRYFGARYQDIRAALDQHWAASDANDFEMEHRIYHEDAVLDYPQSGERTRGRRNIQNQRASQPSQKRFRVRRIIGGGDLWITEFILTYDGKPSYTVSIMEFRGDKVARETQYFADPFLAPAWRAEWVERIDS